MATMFLKEILVNTDMPPNLYNSYVMLMLIFRSLCFVLKSARKELGDMSVFTGISFERILKEEKMCYKMVYYTLCLSSANCQKSRWKVDENRLF